MLMTEKGRKKSQFNSREIAVIVFSLAVFFVFAGGILSAKAYVPNYISYQSRLRDALGNPVTSNITVQFSLYSDLVAGVPADTPSPAGPLLWSETYDGSSGSCPQVTPDVQGYFNIQLGACVLFPDYLNFNTTSPIYLGVKIGSDGEAAPRVRFVANPFALNAFRLSGFEASSTAAANSILALDANLNFNINTGAFMGASFLMSSSTATSSIVGHFTVSGNTDLATTTVTTLTASSLFLNSGGSSSTALMTLQNQVGDIQMFQTAMNPEGILDGSVGDIAIDSVNGNLYVKHTGNATSTGWEAILTQSGLASSTAYVLGGNSFGQNATLGILDAHDLTVVTNNTPALTIDASQNAIFAGNLTVGGIVSSTSFYVSGSGTSTEFYAVTGTFDHLAAVNSDFANVTTTNLRISSLADAQEINVSNTSTLSGPALLGNYMQFTTVGDNNIYFANNNGIYFRWDNTNNLFILSNNLDVNGTISSTAMQVNGDITTTGRQYAAGYIIASSGFRSNQYCDINGNHCFDPSSGWNTSSSGSLPTAISITAATTNGLFSFGGKVGYQAATYQCNAEYPGSHFCFTGEILYIIATQDISPWAVDNAWIAEGPPGYTANSNDCNGYKDSALTKLGAYWAYDPSGGGMGWLVNCGTALPLSCCK